MQHIFPFSIFGCFILAVYFIIVQVRKKEWRYTENRLFTVFCLTSAIWSFGFLGVLLQTDPSLAYIWRAIGMVGTFGYLIVATLLICYLSNIPRKIRYPIVAFSYLGIILYFFVIPKDRAAYQLSPIGMTYSLNSGVWNSMYVGYCIIVALGMLFVIFYLLICSPSQRLKALARKLLATEMILIIGMLFDTIFPIMGNTAIPGSTIAQFVGLAVMYHTISFVNHSRINIDNMSEFIYYSLSVPVLVYDYDKNLQIMNDNAYAFFGIEKGNLNINGLNSLFKTEQENVFYFAGTSKDVDALCRNNDSYCNLSINKICDEYHDIIGYIVIVTDLSERIRAVKKLEEAKQEAEQANKAKSLFLANMSHEIRTPMNAIIGFSELVLTMDIDDSVRHHVEDIKWSSHNLLAIINDILDFSKIESGKIELVNDSYFTASFINDISMIIAPQADKKNLGFSVKVDPNIPTALYGDKTRIRGVLVNILNNAIKYTQQGSVAFDVSILTQTEKYITLQFKVTDTGIGIREEDLHTLFQTFERLDKKINHNIEGTGLGLSIAHKYVTLMGGKIDVESEYTKGSTFIVTLKQKIIDATPFEEDYKQQNALRNTGSISNMKINNTHILVTDDNLINLRVAEGIFSHYGLKVDTASSGNEAIEKCTNTQYDLVFMDHMMPEMDGVEAMEHIRKLNAHYSLKGKCKIIVLTANAIKGTRETLMRNGFDEYLGKPINIHNLERLFKKFIPAELITYDDETNTSDTKDQENSRSQYNFLRSTLSNMDIDSGIANSGGNLTEYINILKITYEYGPKQINELKTAWETKDYENYIIKIHSMKSTTLNIGAMNLSANARRQEAQGREGNYSYIDNHFQNFSEEYNKLLNNIHVVLEHFNMLHPVDSTDNSQVLSNEMITRILKAIDTNIDNFDFGKVFEILEEIKQYSIPAEYTELFEKISAYMDELDVDNIKELLQDKI